MPKPKGATPKKSPDGMSLFAAILVGVLLTLGIVLFVYLWNPFNQGKTDLSTEDTPIVQPKTAITAASQPTNYEFYDLLKEQQVSGVPDQALASQPLPTNPQPDVVVTAKAGDSADNPNSPEVASESGTAQPQDDSSLSGDTEAIGGTSGDEQHADATDNRVAIRDATPMNTYILQINSFDNADEADRRRAEVLMAGVDAQIVKKRLPDDSMVYQVISRPMPNAQMAAQAQRRLQNSGIDSLIVEQRRN